jgi:hypothetical protein
MSHRRLLIYARRNVWTLRFGSGIAGGGGRGRSPGAAAADQSLAAAAVGTGPKSESTSYTSWEYDTASPEARADVFCLS